MINKDLQNSSEDEILSVSDEKIQRMIRNLHRVDAPKDFDFRLKARIATTASPQVRTPFLPALRYALPLSVVVLVFTFVIMSGVYFAGNNEQTAEVVPPTPVESTAAPLPGILPSSLPVVTQTPAESAPNMILAESSPLPKIQTKKKEQIIVEEANFVAAQLPKKPSVKLPTEKQVNEGGSYDSTSSVPPVVRTPVGIPSNDVVEISPNNENKNDIITKQILLPLGIEITSESGNRRVTSVKKGSIAERSNVKVGDLIEAIDGEKVSGDAVRTKTLEGKWITVLRGAERIEISFNK